MGRSAGANRSRASRDVSTSVLHCSDFQFQPRADAIEWGTEWVGVRTLQRLRRQMFAGTREDWRSSTGGGHTAQGAVTRVGSPLIDETG